MKPITTCTVLFLALLIVSGCQEQIPKKEVIRPVRAILKNPGRIAWNLFIAMPHHRIGLAVTEPFHSALTPDHYPGRSSYGWAGKPETLGPAGLLGESGFQREPVKWMMP